MKSPSGLMKLARVARSTLTTAVIVTLVGVSSALAAGEWKYNGISTQDEGPENPAHTAKVTMNFKGEEVFLAVSCSVQKKYIGLSMGGGEKFEQASYAAVKATKGNFSPDESYLDLYIDDQIFGMKTMVQDIDGQLAFLDEFPLNGAVIMAFLKGSGAYLDAPGLQLSIPLKNSANSICTTFKKCSVIQHYCQSTGR